MKIEIDTEYISFQGNSCKTISYVYDKGNYPYVMVKYLDGSVGEHRANNLKPVSYINEFEPNYYFVQIMKKAFIEKIFLKANNRVQVINYCERNYSGFSRTINNITQSVNTIDLTVD